IDSVVSRRTVANTEFQIIDRPWKVCEEFFIGYFPGHGSRREISPLVVFTEARRSVGTQAYSKQVSVVKIVIHPAEVGEKGGFSLPRKWTQGRGTTFKITGAKVIGDKPTRTAAYHLPSVFLLRETGKRVDAVFTDVFVIRKG